MPPEAKMRALAARHGFVEHPAPGFLGFHRTHADGRWQGLNVFWWSNAQHAAALGIPRYYMVFDIAPAASAPGGRFRLPMVVWPAALAEQDVRPWPDVVAEFEEVFLPVFDAPESRGRELVEDLSARYQIFPGGGNGNAQGWVPHSNPGKGVACAEESPREASARSQTM